MAGAGKVAAASAGESLAVCDGKVSTISLSTTWSTG